jgi:hypothetical protein
VKQLRHGKSSWQNRSGAVALTELIAISALVGIGTLAGAKLLADFDAELTDFTAAAHGGQRSCRGPAESAPNESGGLSLAGASDMESRILDDPHGRTNYDRPE